MKRAAHGLTLVEIAIVLTIVGFVAAFALPAWRDHTVRQKVAEVIAAAASGKATVDEFATASGDMPSTSAIALPFTHSRYVLASAWAASGASGAITVTTRPTTGHDESALNAKALVLTATWDAAAKTVRWACGGTPATTIDAEYLPADCR